MNDLKKIAYNLENHYSDAFGVMKRTLENRKVLESVIEMISDLKDSDPSDPVYAELYEKINQVKI